MPRRLGYALLASQEAERSIKMGTMKNLCAPIPEALHQRVRQEQEQRGQTLSDYITDILKEHFEACK